MKKINIHNGNLQPSAEPNSASQQKILIVDDHPDSLRLLSTVLCMRGYKVWPTLEGELALQSARLNPPDLILLDIMMPHMNGYEVCEQLKACSQTKDIPVIFLSALDEVFDKVKAFKAGGVDYITKPFQPEELLVRVENQLRMSRLSKQILVQNALLEAEIEQRKQIEAQLQESKRWLSAVIKTNPNLLYVYDLIEERSLYLNREIYSDIGYSFQEIQQMESAFIPKLIHPDDVLEFSAHRQKIETAKDGESFDIEYRIQHKNGEYRWFSSRETVFSRTAEGKAWKILGTATEISDRKQAELELKTTLVILERQIKQRFLLEKINLEIRYNLNQKQLFQSAATQIGLVFNADRCLIHTYIEHPTPRIPLVAEYKKGKSELASLLNVEIPVQGNPHAELVLSQEKAVVSDDALTEPLLENARDLVKKIGLKSMITIRTSYQGKANGLICLHQYDRPRHWSEDEIRLFEAAAAQLGIAIAQANLLEQEKQQRIQIEQSEASLAAAQKLARMGSWKFDLRSQKITWSEEVFRIFGLDPAEPEPTYPQLLEMYHPEDREFFNQTVNLAICEGKPYKQELRIVHPGGQIRYVEVRGEAIFDKTGEVIQLLGTVMDITERKQTEATLLRSEQREREKSQQLKQTLSQLKSAQAQLIQSEKMSSIGQIVAGVAHEINNPVSFIYSNITPANRYARDLLDLISIYKQYYPEPVSEVVEQIQEMDLDFIAEDFPKILDSMQEGAKRIKQIVLSLRNFSRLDEKDLKVVDIHQGIESSLVFLQHRLKALRKCGEIQVIKQYGDLPMIQCYPAQLNQVFMNLLLNAIDACEESLVIGNASVTNRIPSVTNDSGQICDKHPLIRISTEVDRHNQIVVRIADNGSGISAEVQNRMFDPFFTTKPVGSGTGLGLSISYQIVKERHGGELRCHSEVGNGTEFAIELPMDQKLKVKS